MTTFRRAAVLADPDVPSSQATAQKETVLAVVFQGTSQRDQGKIGRGFRSHGKPRHERLQEGCHSVLVVKLALPSQRTARSRREHSSCTNAAASGNIITFSLLGVCRCSCIRIAGSLVFPQFIRGALQ